MNIEDIPGVRTLINNTPAESFEIIARATWEATLLTAVELLRNAGIDHGWYSAQRYLADMALAEPVWLTPSGDHTSVRLVHSMGGRASITVTPPMDTGSNEPDAGIARCMFCDSPVAPTDDGKHADTDGHTDCPTRRVGRSHVPHPAKDPAS